ncbi:hypothetical protein RLEG12_26150 [Rhizobium leguminosarum bv. trifolii CB782]|uniref:Uncharacterized protein n=1 Tax=Rhizobium hidalgonense TaxID=1538159 RepID=A0A2A6KGB2_9HYPH|nr:hypothetical protein [Rhizobium hidalgonense]AHG46502.1 hypothetical protein RLEG12_26150 [Rhizobium leguminosarum bv. trifolii CB782]EJC77430.1 hypothetical protein Rleg10DRAFT_6137 [Rhizobium leguminosarum bv. trifolii WSM2012]MDR9773538.1 hypothetical protein [Rhizobium hidalgonense]MDR9807275.1 hypothetical protein [Rhizobium hidalgonense]MDR9811157.1 hypothetical protein [Rhizobium hidalgonense]
MLRGPFVSVTRIAFLVATAAFAALAGRELYASIRTASISIVAERIERGETVSDDIAAKYAARTIDIVDGHYCRSDIVAAGVTLVLAQLDRQNVNVEYDAWAAAASSARHYLQHALSCMPTNSNFWLRLAAVQSVIAEEPLSVAEMMTRSVALAPHDEAIILTRFYFWNDLTNATLAAAKTALDSDLLTMLKLGDRCRVNATIKEISPQLRPIFDRTWTELGDGATARFRQRCSK